MKETLSSIAERTGFSITTISRVLSGNAEKYRISKATVDKVIAEAEACNYRPSLIAQSLRTNRTNTIGLLLPSLSNPYFAEMASVIIREVNSRDCTTIVMDTMEDEKNFNSSASLLLSRRVDGIIAVPCGKNPSVMEGIDRDYLPVVLVDRYYDGAALSYVTTNNYQGGADGTRHMISAGHRRIACIQGVRDSSPNAERVRGYLDAMEESGLGSLAEVVGDDFSIQNGYLETKLLLERKDRPTAIFALSNTISLGVLKAVREAGLDIPEDISLLAFDDYAYMDYLNPPLTRISQPVEDMAKLATKLLFDRIGGNGAGNTSQIKLAPALISGASVKH